MNILVTGANGFIGRNLRSRLGALSDCVVRTFDSGNSADEFRESLAAADLVFHLAGVNRPQAVEQYEAGNAGLTERLCDALRQMARAPKVVMTSSIQAELNNPYGVSKRHAEEHLRKYARETGAQVRIYRLKNVFGKWCKPNYNSVVATFCNNIANDEPISVSDASREIELVYIDDVVEALLHELTGGDGPIPYLPTYTITLADLAGRIQAFHEMHSSLVAPDFSLRFNQQLYATYLSYVPAERRLQQLAIRTDARGELAEVIKSRSFGQVFISKTKPGITRGNHYHQTKCEKFLVIEGDAVIRMRHIEENEVVEYQVCGKNFQVIDIPPGFTHAIENVGPGEMTTLFWASEIFDPDHPDTYYSPVLAEMEAAAR